MWFGKKEVHRNFLIKKFPFFLEKEVQFIFLLGVVSLFADLTYEGGRSILGPFFLHLGATASIVGVASGFGEMVGYSFRLLSGYIADRTKQYWFLMFLGYTVNLFAFPLLAFVRRWDVAVGIVVAERLGKALRHPSRDTLLSFASARIGAGLGFGFHEAMDQIGAVLGPLLVFFLLLFSKQFSSTFALLIFPASLSLFSLLVAYRFFPHPQTFPLRITSLEVKGIFRYFFVYLISVMLVAGGYADFPLIAYHIQKHQFTSPLLIPILYAVAMCVDALSALYFGKLFDRIGISSLVLAIFLSSFSAVFAFSSHFLLIPFGILLWGIGMGAQESILRSAITLFTLPEKRATAFGIFHTFFGIAWFLGSATMGKLYDISPLYLILFSFSIQFFSLPFLFWLARLKSSFS